MKTIRINWIFLFILTLFFFGCKKDDECIKSIDINGEWIWVKSVGGFGGWTITPASEGVTKKIIFDDCTYKAFVNDSLVSKTGYELEISNETEEVTFIKFDSGQKQIIIISDSKFELKDQCDDCFSHHYIRN